MHPVPLDTCLPEFQRNLGRNCDRLLVLAHCHHYVTVFLKVARLQQGAGCLFLSVFFFAELSAQHLEALHFEQLPGPLLLCKLDVVYVADAEFFRTLLGSIA